MQLSEPPDHTPDLRSDTGIRVTGLKASPLPGRAALRPGRPEKAPFRQADVEKKYVNRNFLGKYLSYSDPTSPVGYSSKTEQILKWAITSLIGKPVLYRFKVGS